MFLPGTQTLSLGLSQLPAPFPEPPNPIGCRRGRLPSDIWSDFFFFDWLSLSITVGVRLQGGEEELDSSPATKHLQPDDTEVRRILHFESFIFSSPYFSSINI